MPATYKDDPADIALLTPPGAEDEPTADTPPTLEYHSKVVPPKPAPVQPLDDGSAEAMAALFFFGRRMCFAIGMSMLGYGLGGGGQYASTMGLGLFGVGIRQLFHNDAASATMGVGLLLVGVCIPLWRF